MILSPHVDLSRKRLDDGARVGIDLAIDNVRFLKDSRAVQRLLQRVNARSPRVAREFGVIERSDQAQSQP